MHLWLYNMHTWLCYIVSCVIVRCRSFVGRLYHLSLSKLFSCMRLWWFVMALCWCSLTSQHRIHAYATKQSEKQGRKRDIEDLIVFNQRMLHAFAVQCFLYICRTLTKALSKEHGFGMILSGPGRSELQPWAKLQCRPHWGGLSARWNWTNVPADLRRLDIYCEVFDVRLYRGLVCCSCCLLD